MAVICRGIPYLHLSPLASQILSFSTCTTTLLPPLVYSFGLAYRRNAVSPFPMSCDICICSGGLYLIILLVLLFLVISVASRASYPLYPLPPAIEHGGRPLLVTSCLQTIAVISDIFLLPHWRTHGTLHF